MGAKPSPSNTESARILLVILGTTVSANIDKEVKRFYFIYIVDLMFLKIIPDIEVVYYFLVQSV